MAKKGFEYAVVAKLKEDGTYEAGKYLGPTSTFNVTTTSNDVKDYGDNRAVMTDTSVTGGTTSIEINEMANELYAFCLGHALDEEKDEVVCKNTDLAPYLGMGAVGISRAETGGNKYTAKFYTKTQCKEPNDENATQQETLTLTHTTLEGNMFVPEDGIWKKQATFDTLAAAKAWLNELAGITVTTGTSGSEA